MNNERLLRKLRTHPDLWGDSDKSKRIEYMIEKTKDRVIAARDKLPRHPKDIWARVMYL